MLIYSKRFVMNETEVPAVVLDTDKVTVTENGDRQKITKFFTDYARYHLRYVAEINPDRLQRLVDEGKIIDYLNDLEDRCERMVVGQRKWHISKELLAVVRWKQ